MRLAQHCFRENFDHYLHIFEVLIYCWQLNQNLTWVMTVTLFSLSTKASFWGCQMNLKHVNTLTPYSQCISPSPTVHKQAPDCLIGQAVHRWQCSLSSPVATVGAPTWFPRWSAPLAHLERGAQRYRRNTQTDTNGRTHMHQHVHTPRQTVC